MILTLWKGVFAVGRYIQLGLCAFLMILTCVLTAYTQVDRITFHAASDDSIATHQAVKDGSAVTESVPVLIQKEKIKPLFSRPTIISIGLCGKFNPYKYFKPVFSASSFLLFIPAIHYQSNYLA